MAIKFIKHFSLEDVRKCIENKVELNIRRTEELIAQLEYLEKMLECDHLDLEEIMPSRSEATVYCYECKFTQTKYIR